MEFQQNSSSFPDACVEFPATSQPPGNGRGLSHYTRWYFQMGRWKGGVRTKSKVFSFCGKVSPRIARWERGWGLLWDRLREYKKLKKLTVAFETPSTNITSFYGDGRCIWREWISERVFFFVSFFFWWKTNRWPNKRGKINRKSLDLFEKSNIYECFRPSSFFSFPFVLSF